jgi:WD40 repeat protein
LRMWDPESHYLKPVFEVAEAHIPRTDTSRISFSKDRFSVVSRGGDHTLKLWDLRKFTKPIKEINDLPNFYPETDVIFSPDENFIITGTSVRKEGSGKLIFYDKHLEEKESLSLANLESPIRILWPEKLNQIFVTTSSGLTKVFFDPTISHNGVLISLPKEEKRKVQEMYTSVKSEEKVYHWNEDQGEENQETIKLMMKNKVRMRLPNPLPENQINGMGKEGYIGESPSHLVMKTILKDTMRDENPRDALLKYAEKSKENPIWIDHVYKKTQPKPIFDYTRDKIEDERVVKRRK